MIYIGIINSMDKRAKHVVGVEVFFPVSEEGNTISNICSKKGSESSNTTNHIRVVK